MTYQELYTKLVDDSSNAFLGSAIALSSYSLFNTFDEDRSEDFLELSSADELLYEEQVKNESIYSSSDIIKALSCYDDCLSDFIFASRLNSDGAFKKMIEMNYQMFDELFFMSYNAVNQKRGITYTRNKEEPLQNKRRYLIDLNEKNMVDVLLPLLAVFRKLLKRRQNGKKPYTFHDETMDMIDLLDRMIEERIITGNELVRLSDFALKCTSEIKMVSLKNDYIYLSGFFENAVCYFR